MTEGHMYSPTHGSAPPTPATPAAPPFEPAAPASPPAPAPGAAPAPAPGAPAPSEGVMYTTWVGWVERSSDELHADPSTVPTTATPNHCLAIRMRASPF